MKYQDLFKEFSTQLLKAQEKIEINKAFVQQNTENIEKYKKQLILLQNKIDDLKSQEDQAVADITSSRQITKLNELLAGLSTDVNMQGIETIEEARKKALANAKLSTELSQSTKTAIDEELLAAGSNLDEEFAKMLAEEEAKMTNNINQERKL